MKVTRLGATLGAAIEGVDLRKLDDRTFAAIKGAFLEHCVVAIRGQFIEPAPQIAFARRFGKLNMTAGTEIEITKGLDTLTGTDNPMILKVRNLGKSATVTEHWHADNVHVPRPTAISILAAQAIPETGGDTMFCNQYNSYERLSGAMQRKLRGMRLRHSGAMVPVYRLRPAEEAPFAIHPVVATHPDTGRRALYLGGRPSRARNTFEGFTEEETLPLQKFLFEHSFVPENIYRHRWLPGDVLMWDNRAVMHYAVHDYGDQVRDMNRATVEGHEPYEAPYDD